MLRAVLGACSENELRRMGAGPFTQKRKQIVSGIPLNIATLPPPSTHGSDKAEMGVSTGVPYWGVSGFDGTMFILTAMAWCPRWQPRARATQPSSANRSAKDVQIRKMVLYLYVGCNQAAALTREQVPFAAEPSRRPSRACVCG